MSSYQGSAPGLAAAHDVAVGSIQTFQRYNQIHLARFNARASLNIFGGNDSEAHAIASKILLSVTHTDIMELNKANGISNLDQVPSVDLPTEVGTIFENRALSEWDFRFEEHDVAVVDTIETTEPSVDLG